MTESLDEHGMTGEEGMTDEEYEKWLAHYGWGTDIDIRLGKHPKDIPIRVYKYWERKGIQPVGGTETNDNSDDPDG